MLLMADIEHMENFLVDNENVYKKSVGYQLLGNIIK